MNKELMSASAAAVIALAPLCIPPAQAHADDPCDNITDPAAHQTCIDESLRDNPYRPHMGDCQASPNYGAEGQFCRNSWSESLRPKGRRGYAERLQPCPPTRISRSAYLATQIENSHNWSSTDG
jgi:hypothetical protein